MTRAFYSPCHSGELRLVRLSFRGALPRRATRNPQSRRRTPRTRSPGALGVTLRNPGIRSRHESSPFPLEPEPAELEAQTRAVADFVLAHVASLAEQPSFDLDGVEALRASFREPLPETARPLAELLERLGPAIAKSYNTAGPGYLAYIPGGGVYASALADFIATATNRYVGVTAAAPALAQIEETVRRLAVHADGSACRVARHPHLGRIALELQRPRDRPRGAARRGLPGRVDLPLRGDAPLRREGRPPRRVPASEPAHAADRRALPAGAGGAGGGHPGGPDAGPPAVPRRRQRRHDEHRRRGSPARDRRDRPRARPLGPRRRRLRRLLPAGPGRRGAPARASRTATRSPSTRTRASSCRTASGRSSCATGRLSPAPTAAAPATSRT